MHCPAGLATQRTKYQCTQEDTVAEFVDAVCDLSEALGALNLEELKVSKMRSMFAHKRLLAHSGAMITCKHTCKHTQVAVADVGLL